MTDNWRHKCSDHAWTVVTNWCIDWQVNKETERSLVWACNIHSLFYWGPFCICLAHSDPVMVTGHSVQVCYGCRCCGAVVLLKDFFVYPHKAAGLIGFGLVLDAVEAVAELAVFSLVIVVVFHLPHCLKHTSIFELEKIQRRWEKNRTLVTSMRYCTYIAILQYR